MPKPQPPAKEEPIEGKCNYIKTDGTRCRNPAGKGTPHLGEGRCNKHGGPGRPIVHGRYSKFKSNLPDKYEEFLAETDWLNLKDEVAKARAYLVEVEEAHGRFESQEAFMDCANKFLKTVADLVSRAHKIEEGETYNINVNQMMYMVNQIVMDIEAICGDCPHRLELAERIGNLDLVNLWASSYIVILLNRT